jgi:hypothetical protein
VDQRTDVSDGDPTAADMRGGFDLLSKVLALKKSYSRFSVMLIEGLPLRDTERGCDATNTLRDDGLQWRSYNSVPGGGVYILVSRWTLESAHSNAEALVERSLCVSPILIRFSNHPHLVLDRGFRRGAVLDVFTDVHETVRP